MADPVDIVNISVADTTEESYRKVRIFVNEKNYKEASRTVEKSMIVMISGTFTY